MMFTTTKISTSLKKFFTVLSVPLALAVLLVGLESSASAKARVAIVKVTGPQSAKFQKQVETLVRASATLVSQAQFRKATKQIRRFKPNRNGLRKVAQRLKLSGFIEGKVTRAKGKFVLTLSFRDAQGDALSDDISIRSKRANLSRNDRRRLGRELKRALRRLETADGGDDSSDDDSSNDDSSDDDSSDDDSSDDDSSDDDSSDDDSSDDDSSDDDSSDDDSSDDDSSDDDSSDDDSSSDDDDAPAASDTAAALSRRSRPIEALVGFSFTSRKLSFDADAAAVPPQGYSGALVPGLVADLSLFPLAFDSKRTGVLRNIGVTVFVDKVLSIKSQLEGMADTVLETSQIRYGFGAVYRHNFSPKKDSGISIRGTLRYSVLSFNIKKDDTPTVTLPNVEYSYIEPGLALSIPVTQKIDLGVGAHFYVIRSTGEIQDIEQYGGAAVSGFDADVTASYMLMPQILLRASARYSAISYTFNGSGVLTDRDGDQEQDVAGATDRYISLFGTAGYLF